MRTIVLKFPDEYDLTRWWSTKANTLFDFPQSWNSTDLKLSQEYYSYQLIEPTKEIIGPLFSFLESESLKLRSLFVEASSEGLRIVIERASAKTKKAYRFTNFFNYYQLICPDEQARSILQKLGDYVQYKKGDELGRPLKTAYLKSTSTPLINLCSGSISSAKYWTDLGLKTFYQTHFNQLARTTKWPTLHETESSWGPNPLFVNSIRLTAPNSVIKRSPPNSIAPPYRDDEVHGCAVLGLLFSKGVTQTNTVDWTRIGTDTVPNGLIPLAKCLLYSSGDGSIPQLHNILQAVLQKHAQPGDVVLIEKSLTEVPLRAGERSPVSSLRIIQRGLGEFTNILEEYPAELEDDIFDLIQVATHSLCNVTVIQPVGNGWADLDLYSAYMNGSIDSTSNHINRWMNSTFVAAQSTTVRGTLASFRPYSVNHRCYHYDITRDSGAILVGAATRENKQQYGFGSRLDICGPGYRVPTTYPSSNPVVSGLCKTSAAAAIIAGIVILIQALVREQGNEVSSQQIRLALRQNALPEDEPIRYRTIVNSFDVQSIADSL